MNLHLYHIYFGVTFLYLIECEDNIVYHIEIEVAFVYHTDGEAAFCILLTRNLFLCIA